MAKKICLVDDEPDILAIVQCLLEAKNFEVRTARDGLEGMDLIAKEKPDLAILDLMMPGKSGLQMCKELRASDEFCDLPILVLSAIAKDSDKPEEYWAAGLSADDFVRKPFEPMDLLGRVEYLLRRDSYGKQTAPAGSAVAAQSASDLTNPEDVVKKFIESWNIRDFRGEFDCLANEMQYGLSQQEYAERRTGSYSESGGDSVKQHYARTIDLSNANDIATVECERKTERGNNSENRKEVYRLKQTDQGWKIFSVRIKK